MMTDPGNIDGEAVVEWLREEGILDVAEGFGVEEDLFLAGLDSMAVMQMVVAAEQRFGVVLQAGDLSRDRLETAERLAELIRERLG